MKPLKITARIIFIIIYMAVILVCAKQALNFFYNEYVLSKYDNKDYSINEKLLLTANFLEPYIVYYNNGNIAYKNSLFQEAIDSYEEALNYKLPKKRECDLRVNLALAKIKLLPEDYDSKDNINDSIKLLEETRDVLLEKGCAKEDGDGHNDDAQELLDEIDKELERLKSQAEQMEENNPEENKDNQSEEEKQKEEEQDKREEEVKEELEEIADEAYEERQEELDGYEENDIDWWNVDFNFEGIW